VASEKSVAARQSLITNALGRLLSFRYLKVEQKGTCTTNGATCVTISSREPSSDLAVDFVVRKKVSLDKIAGVSTGEAVAVSGRLAGADERCTRLTLDPAIVQHKDRLAPKTGTELLRESGGGASQPPDHEE
jgi:hypothetical protein